MVKITRYGDVEYGECTIHDKNSDMVKKKNIYKNLGLGYENL